MISYLLVAIIWATVLVAGFLGTFIFRPIRSLPRPDYERIAQLEIELGIVDSSEH